MASRDPLGRFPLGSPPDFPVARRSGGLLDRLGVEARSFVQAMLALRREREERAFRSAQLELQRRAQERLERQGGERLGLERERVGLSRERIEEATARREAEAESAAAFGRIIDALDAGREPAPEDRAALVPADARALASETALRQRQRQAEGRRTAAREARTEREQQLATATAEAAGLLRRGVESERVQEALQSARGELFPDLDDSDVRLAFSRAVDTIAQEQRRTNATLRRLQQVGVLGEGFDAEVGGELPAGLLNVEERDGGGAGDGSGGDGAAASELARVENAIRLRAAQGEDPETLIERARENRGAEFAEALRQRLSDLLERGEPQRSDSGRAPSLSPSLRVPQRRER